MDWMWPVAANATWKCCLCDFCRRWAEISLSIYAHFQASRLPRKKTAIWRQGRGRLCSRLGGGLTLWRWLFNAHSCLPNRSRGLGKGSWNEPGQCNFPVCVCEPLGAAVWPQRPPSPRRTVQVAAVFPPVPVLPGLRWVQMQLWFYCDCKLLCR